MGGNYFLVWHEVESCVPNFGMVELNTKLKHDQASGCIAAPCVSHTQIWWVSQQKEKNEIGKQQTGIYSGYMGISKLTNTNIQKYRTWMGIVTPYQRETWLYRERSKLVIFPYECGMNIHIHLLFQHLPEYRRVYPYPAGNTARALMVPAWYLIHMQLVNKLPVCTGVPNQIDNFKVIPRYFSRGFTERAYWPFTVQNCVGRSW